MNALNLFMNEKPAKALIALSDRSRVWYARMLAKEIDTTYAHAVNLLDRFAELGLVVFEKEGRIKIVRLTKEGEELANLVQALVRRLESLEKNI